MNRQYRPLTVLNLAAALVFTAAGGALAPAHAQKCQAQSLPPDHERLQSAPVMAIVGVKDQRISLYDAQGNVMRSKVSSGSTGYETPPGTYSILQKNKEHYSNLYDDAAMPFMQRLTWSGVALHEGVLPGYPASHGCVRMPNGYAEQIFPITKIGMRVIIARDSVAPVEVEHPVLLKQPAVLAQAVVTRTAYEEPSDDDAYPKPFLADLRNWPERQTELDALLAAAAEKASEAEMRKAPIEGLKSDVAGAMKMRAAAAKSLRHAEQARRVADDKVATANRALEYAKAPDRLKPWEAAKAKADAAVLTATERLNSAERDVPVGANERQLERAERAARAAERNLRSAVANAARADRDLASAKLPARYKKQEDALAKATAAAAALMPKFNEANERLKAADAELKDANDDLAKATAAMDAAIAEATDAKRKTLPISLFISRKTQRLYLRQGHEPILDIPVAIADPEMPIGTHVYTAVDYKDTPNELRWTAVSLDRRPGREVAELSSKSRQRDAGAAEPYVTDQARALSALDRITIPPEIIARVSPAMWPGSSLIVSDEPAHKETNQATDFIVIMSGEPQGGIKRRPKPAPQPLRRYYDDPWMDGPNDRIAYDRYGRKVRIIQQKKPLFSWW